MEKKEKNGWFGVWSRFLAVAMVVLMLGSVFTVLATVSSEGNDRVTRDGPTLKNYCYNYGGVDEYRGYYINNTGQEGVTVFWTTRSHDRTVYRGRPYPATDIYSYYGPTNNLTRLDVGSANAWPSPDDTFNSQFTFIYENATGFVGWTYTKNSGATTPKALDRTRMTTMPSPNAALSGSNIDLTWSAPSMTLVSEQDATTDITDINAQLKGYLIYRSNTTNATWNDNASIATVIGSPSDWVLVDGTVSSPITGTSWTDTNATAGTTNYYSLKLVFNGSAYVGTMWGSLGSNGVTTGGGPATVDYIQIHNQTWNGADLGGVAISMTTDQTLTLWCAGYNYTSGFVDNVSATWGKTGTLDAPSAGPATNIAFNPSTAGTSGTITVSYLTKTNATGTITVSTGALASIKITDSAGGTEVTTATLSVGETLNLYASGYDADSNYKGLISCTWGKTGTLDAPTAGPATNIAFTPTTGGTSGTITADDGATHTDATGTITVSSITIDYIQIHNNTWDGSDLGGVAISMTTDQTLTLWCAGYNNTSGFVDNVSATWGKTGTLDAVTAGPATNIAFNPSTAGTSGTITVTYSGKTNATGTITVSTGALASIKITSSAGGAEVTTATLSVGETLNLYASGYDADSNYKGLISCTWGKTGTLDAPTAGPATNIAFTPTTGGTSGTITADDGATHTDATGTITVTSAGIDYIQIHNQTWNGADLGGVAISMTTDQTLTLWCAGYNNTSGFVDNVSATWGKTGTLDAVTAGPATNIAFNPSTAATSGTITVTSGTKTNATGTITVSAGALASIKITSSAGGAEVTTATLSVGETLNLYASGYDADSNYKGLISCTWGKTGTLDAPTAGPATNIAFTPTTGGTSGTITADDGATHTDATGTITVTSAGIDYIQIHNQTWNGADLGGVAISMTTDQTLTLWCAGYNNTSGFVDNVSATWGKTGTLDAPSAGPATNIAFNPSTAGTSGTITVSYLTKTNATGTITVSAGALASIKITDSAGGTEVTTATLSVGETLNLYASGYDADSNYKGLISCTWGKTGTLDAPTAGPATNIAFTPTTGGTSGTITADDGATHTDATGTITVTSAGIDYIVVTDAPNGVALTTVVRPVGGTVIAYASGYNNTGPTYVSLVTCTWTGTGGSWSPSTGTSSTFTAGFTGGTFIQTATSTTVGGSDTFSVQVLTPTVDYIKITYTAGGTEIPNDNIAINTNQHGYASSYNTTSGYNGTVIATWTVVNGGGATASRDNATADNCTFSSGANQGNATWRATYLGKTDTVEYNIVAGLANVTVTYSVPTYVLIGSTYNLSVTLKNIVAEPSASIRIVFWKSDDTTFTSPGEEIGNKTYSLTGYQTLTVYSDNFTATGTFYKIHIESQSSGDYFNGYSQYWDTQQLGLTPQSTGVTPGATPSTGFYLEIAGAVIAVVVVAALATWYMRKKKKTELK